MIMAARADGHIDGKERELLSQEIAKLQPDDELHSWIQQQFDAPLILLSLHEQLIALKVRGRFTW